MEKNRKNFDALHARMDWSHKIDGQSREFLPKTSTALEQFTAVVKKALTGSKDWYMPVLGRASKWPLSEEQCRALLDGLLSGVMVNESEELPIQLIIPDGLKMGALGSLAIFKVYGALREYPQTDETPAQVPQQYGDNFDRQNTGSLGPTNSGQPMNAGEMQAGTTVQASAPASGATVGSGNYSGPPAGAPDNPEINQPPQSNQPGYPGGAQESQGRYNNNPKEFRLRIELIRPEDYYPDPTGRGLYRIHRSEKDFHEVEARAQEGVYDMQAVNGLRQWFEQERLASRSREMGENVRNPPSFRRVVTIDEYWGDILDDNGHCVARNIFMAIGNDRFLLRPPKANPWWHGKNPFVEVPIMRVPKSVWHRALFDAPVDLNVSMNELYSLMVDGAIGSVWGIKQVRIDDLESPEQVAGGIPQGATIAVKSSLPAGAKAVEDVSTGKVPPEALQIFELVNSEFMSSAMTNELRFGQLPSRGVKATEVVALEQSQGNMAEAVATDIERGISEILYRCWMVAIQHLELIDAKLVIDSIGPQAALTMLRMPPAMRKQIFSNRMSFRVNGMSAMLARTKDFQKMMALVQAIGSNPILLMAFFKNYAPELVLNHMIKSLSIDPEQLIRDSESLTNLPMELMQLQIFNQMALPQKGGQQGPGGQNPAVNMNAGGASLGAQVNQMSNPLTGIPSTK